MAASVPTESGKLDLIRSFAVILVVFSHLPISQKIFDSLLGQHVLHVQAMGILGVGIFFVHTCFVLMLSLERQTIRQGKADLVKTFLIRRVFRIYPLSIVTVLMVFTVAWQTGGGSADYATLTSNLLLIQNLTGHPSNPAPLWSLPFEVQMYLFLPALYLLVDRARDKATLCVLAIWAGCAVLVLATWALGQNYHIIKYLPAFLPGVAAYSLRARTATLPASLPAIYILLMAFQWRPVNCRTDSIG